MKKVYYLSLVKIILDKLYKQVQKQKMNISIDIQAK